MRPASICLFVLLDILKEQRSRGYLSPAIICHIFSAKAVDRIHIAFEHSVIITVHSVSAYRDLTAPSKQNLAHADRFQCGFQIVYEISDALLRAL